MDLKTDSTSVDL